MAKVRIKKNNIPKLREEIKKRTRQIANRTFPAVIKDEIINNNILKGKSPAQGGGRFKKYSESYRNAIRSGRFTGKGVTPVNMKLTGEMIKSFFVTNIPNGFRVGFDDIKARWHQLGLGKLPERLLLPTKNGKFNRRASKRFNQEIADIVKKVSRKIKIKRFFGF